MNHSLEFKGFDPAPAFRASIEKEIAHLEKRAKAFPPDAASLRLAIEKTASGREYRFSLTSEFPHKTLAATVETRDLKEGLRQVFRDLERQLQDYKSSLRHEYLWKRLARREELQQKKHGDIGAEDVHRETFFALVNPHLNSVFEYVGHEVEYAEAMGDLAPEEVATEEVVNAALVRAYQQFIEDPARGDIRRWLIRLANDQLASMIGQSRKARQDVPLEEELPRTAPEEWVNKLGEDMIYFYQPDDKLKVEDTVADPDTRTPAEAVETEDTRRCVRSSLMSMPGDLRRVLFLHFIQGLSVADVANMRGESIDKIQQQIDKGKEYLRQKLIEAGCVIAP